jgi:hypothetical protein
MLAMKIRSRREVDKSDAIALLRHLGSPSAAEVEAIIADVFAGEALTEPQRWWLEGLIAGSTAPRTPNPGPAVM